MPHSIRDRLARQANADFVGRAAEIGSLLRALDDNGPVVVHVHGPPGIGKSTLLDGFASAARAEGVRVLKLDCRLIEPTQRGFLYELGRLIGEAASPSVESISERLAGLGACVVLALDTYEVFGLLDTWLRQTFLPALSDNVRVFLFGRRSVSSAWATSPGWLGLFRELSLGSLTESAALELLARYGVTSLTHARRINRLACGHPLALTLAAASVGERADLELEEVMAQRVVARLVQLYLESVDHPIARQALEAGSVVRRITRPLLRAMLPTLDPDEAFAQLRALHFVAYGRDGLVIHEAVQQAITAGLRASDPTAYRAYRRAAWHELRAEAGSAGTPELWRYTADMLYLIENPVVREAFFPSDAATFVVEPSRLDDAARIRAISARHEGALGAALLDSYWQHAPSAFSTVRAPDGQVAGFSCAFQASDLSPVLQRSDPIVGRWRQHLRADPVPAGQAVLFLRRWLSDEHGEAPSPVQAACWLDLKRAYMELRPRLRRVYLTVRDLPTYAPVAQTLGFRPLPRAEVEIDGMTYHSAVLDFGPASVDGWLTGLVAAELGVQQDSLVDVEAQELVIDGRRLGLTRLECGVLSYLEARAGRAVSRAALLRDVWGYEHPGSSNVVDVVIRALRKKLGGRATQIETVSGVGYRFRRG